MSEQLTIDSFSFARDGRVLAGNLAVSGLERLHDLLAGVEGEVRYRLEGSQGKGGEPRLRLEVAGWLPLACQRCLQAIHFDLEIASLLELVPEGAELSQDELEDDERDFLPVAGELDVADLIEDEILLALPPVPRHERCGLPGKAEAGEIVSPFEVLGKLKSKPN